MTKPDAEKYATVMQLNTYYFSDVGVTDKYQGSIEAIANLLQNLYEKVKRDGPKEDFFDEVLQKPYGLEAILALNGLSLEQLKRIITFSRIMKDADLDQLLLRVNWSKPDKKDAQIKEWDSDTLKRLAREDAFFRRGLINLFFNGASNPRLVNVLPALELHKLGVRKLNFDVSVLLYTLANYQKRGGGAGANNAEILIRKILDDYTIVYTQGDLPLLPTDTKRRMDFIIPDKENPLLVIESSYLTTTSSGQGDKAKTEKEIRKLLKKHYPKALFVGFVDGIGWYVRSGDLQRMVEAYDDVFTFHPTELKRFEALVRKVIGGN